MCDYQSLTTSYKYLFFVRTPDISIRIYQPFLVSSENVPQEVSIDVIKILRGKHVNPGGGSNEPVLYIFQCIDT